MPLASEHELLLLGGELLLCVQLVGILLRHLERLLRRLLRRLPQSQLRRRLRGRRRVLQLLWLRWLQRLCPPRRRPPKERGKM